MTDPATSRATKRDAGVEPAGEPLDGWPVELRGVTESVVSTLGPNDLYNQAALGVHAGDPVTAQTWGRTRTRRNFEARGEAFVQFVADPVAFVEAALGIYETDAPLVGAADAWCRVTVEEVDSGTEGNTEWREWELTPVGGDRTNQRVPLINRAHGAVIEATVAASRLDVPGYDEQTLLTRLEHHASVVERCGGSRERTAFDRLCSLVPWEDRLDRS